MRNLIQAFKRWLRGKRRMAAHKFSAATFHKMIRQLAATEAVEYACDDVLRVLDQFAEAFLRGENVAQLMPLVQRHLDMCPDCREEFEALLRILRAGAAPA